MSWTPRHKLPGFFGPFVSENALLRIRVSKNFLLPTYYLPITEWRALIDILLALADPRLAPFWIAALAEAWAIGGRSSPEQDRLTWALAALAALNVALFWICIPYRTQQRFMLQRWAWQRCRWRDCSIAGAGSAWQRPPCSIWPDPDTARSIGHE